MIKAIVSVLWLLFLLVRPSFSATLLDFSTLKVSDSVQNLIFTFNRIGKYRFIMLSNNYWYIAENGKLMKILTKPQPKYLVKRVLIRNIRNETRIYVKMDPNYHYRYRIFISADRRFLVVRAKITSRKGFKQVTKRSKQLAAKREPIIVIDPGHGGKDPGAIGPYSKEKNIVLKIAKYVAYYLRKDHYRVYLTRTKDTYPTLAQRAQLANRVGATLFVSIHANYALKDKDQARGLEVYLLNTTSDKRALQLAARENGMSVKQISDINKIILSLIQTSKIDKSKVLASDVYKWMLKEGRTVYKGYKGRGVKQAPFYVLVDTHCPSILIETAFINNPVDALYLKNRRFQKMLALGIAKGIEQYVKTHPQKQALLPDNIFVRR